MLIFCQLIYAFFLIVKFLFYFVIVKMGFVAVLVYNERVVFRLSLGYSKKKFVASYLSMMLL